MAVRARGRRRNENLVSFRERPLPQRGELAARWDRVGDVFRNSMLAVRTLTTFHGIDPTTYYLCCAIALGLLAVMLLPHIDDVHTVCTCLPLGLDLM